MSWPAPKRDTDPSKPVFREGSSISEQNVQAVHSCLAAINAHDRDAFFAVLDPGIEWHMVGFFLDQEADRKGYEEVWDYMKFLAEEFEEIHSEVEELIEVDDRMVVPIRVTAKAARTGAKGELRFTSVFTVRDGRIVEVRNYTGKDEALEAVGQEPR